MSEYYKMSEDYNTGWRKRQIALDKKAENARELGLDYEPSIIEMARRAGAVFPADGSYHKFERHEDLEAFAAMVREEATAEANARANASWTLMCEKMVAIEREACAKIADKSLYEFTMLTSNPPKNGAAWSIGNAIRARGQA